MSELKNCPFCGKGFLRGYCLPSYPPQYGDHCPLCGYDSLKTTISSTKTPTARNTRTVAPRFTQEERDALLDVCEMAGNDLAEYGNTEPRDSLDLVEKMLQEDAQ